MGGMEARAGTRGVLLIRVVTGCGVDPARQRVTGCVSLEETVTPTLTLPRYAGEGTRDSPPLSALFADGGGWGGGRP